MKKFKTVAQRENRKFRLTIIRYALLIGIIYFFIFLATVYRPHN